LEQGVIRRNRMTELELDNETLDTGAKWGDEVF